MSSRITIKKIPLDSWLSEVERIESFADVEDQLDAFFEMLDSTGAEPESVMTEGEALQRIHAYEEMRSSFDAEIRLKADLFLDAFPPRLWAMDAPRPIGVSLPLVEESLNCWYLTPADIEQLKPLGEAIVAYCKGEVARIANPTGLRRLTPRSFREEKEYKFRCVGSYAGRWVKTLESALQSEVGLLVYET